MDVTVNARLKQGVLLQGGVSSGKTMTDNCELVAQLPEVNISGSTITSTDFCHVDTKFLTQVKLLGSYTMPWDVQVAATYQSLPGPQILANYVATNAQISPSLGRNLSAGATASINIVTPGTLYGERLNQLDMRVSKIVKLNRGARVRGMFDLYNLTNASAVLAQNNTYGTNGAVWQNPTQIVPGRLAKFGVQLDF